MTEIFTAGAVLDLVDNVTPKLGLLGQEFGKFDLRIGRTQELLDKLSLQVAVTKIRAEFAEIGGMADKAAANITGSFDKLAVSTAPAFADIEKKAQTAFGAMSEAAKQGFISVVGTTAHMSQVVGDEFAALEGKAAGVFAPMAESARTSSAAAIADIEAVNAAIEGSIAKVQTLGTVASERGAAGAVASAIPGSGRGASLSHRKGSGGPHFGRVGTEIPGGHVSMPGGPALGIAGILGFGMYEAAEAQDVTAKAGITGQLDMGGDFQNSAQAKAMQELMQKTASASGYSLQDAGDAILGVERMMAGLNFDTRLQTMNTLLPYASAEARLKHTSLEESFKSMVGLAHQTGVYDPKQLEDLVKQFSFASLATDASLPQLEKTLSYSLPVLHAGLDMDPRSIMMLTIMAQNAGITSTKSGTWLRSFFQQAEPGEGTTLSVKKHNAALRKLGMLDDENNVTWRKTGADGKIDWTASVLNVSKVLGEHIRALPIDERLQTLHTAFGERGGSFGSLMAIEKFVEQMPIIAGKMQNFKGGESALEDYSKNSPVQKMRETWRDFENLLMDIGEKALPVLNVALKDLDTVLKQLPADWAATKKQWSDRMDNLPLTKALPKAGEPPDGGVGGLFAPSAYVEGEGGLSGMQQAVERGAWLGVMMGLKDLPGIGGGSAGGIIQASYTGSGFDQAMAKGPGRTGGSGRFASLPTGGAGRGGDDPAMGGRARESWNFWKGKGLTDEAAAGLLGMEQGENNFQANSGMFKGWGDGGAAYGSFMWHADRRAKIFAGTGINVIGASHQKQLEAAYWELTKGDERGHMAAIARANSPAAGARAGVFGFERPADKEGASRLRGRYADHWYQQFHGSVPNAAPGVASGKRMAPLQAPQQPVQINIKTHLDGKIVAENTTHHQMAANRFTGGHSYHDDHAHYAPPDVAFG